MRALARIGLIVVAVVVLSAMATQNTYAARGDGILLYGEGTVTTPRYRSWTNSSNTLGSEQTGTTAATGIRHTILKAAPTRNEMIAGIQTTGGTLYIQRWNGSSWTNEWNVAVGNGNISRFDIAYERQSGRAIVFYTRNIATTNEIRYNIWDGTNWGGAQDYNAVRTSGIIDAIKVVSQKASNIIAIAWGDRNFDLSATVWDGDTNTFKSEPTAALSTNLAKAGTSTTLTNQSFDVAYENTSNELLVAWGNDTIQDLSYVTRSAGGGTWGSAVTNTAFPEEPTDIELISETGTDTIAYVNASDNGSDGGTGIWDGASWGNLYNFDTTLDTVGVGKNISGAWLNRNGESRFVLIYDDANAVGVDWRVFNKNTSTWTAPGDYTAAPAPVSGNDRMLRMYMNPFNASEAIALIEDTNSDLFVKKMSFDGTNLTWSSVEPGGTSPENNLSTNTGLPADFAYSRYIVPATLGVDMLDENDAPVASPGITFASLNTSFSCQTNPATLGKPDAKVRVGNGTANELWTLTIAATGGATANWSNGSTGQFDYNDPAGTPAGCADGADADSLPGRLSIDASGADVAAPQYDCDTSGVSKGSLAGFSQGVTNAITIASTSSSAIKNCDYDITNIELNQQVPPERQPGNYTINMTLTVTAN